MVIRRVPSASLTEVLVGPSKVISCAPQDLIGYAWRYLAGSASVQMIVWNGCQSVLPTQPSKLPIRPQPSSVGHLSAKTSFWWWCRKRISWELIPREVSGP